MTTQPPVQTEPTEQISIDDLAAGLLSKTVINAVEETKGYTFGFYFFVEDGVVSVAFGGSARIARLLAVLSSLAAFLWAIWSGLLPALGVVIERILN